MIDLGKYQNDIDNLKQLELEDYERIFKIYNATSNNKNFSFYNILRKIDMPDVIDDELVDTYTVNVRTGLTIISYNIYGTIKLWWLIYLINQKLLGSNRFIVPGGTVVKFIKPELLFTVFSQITNVITKNGRHY